jgi:TfoX/Sxy family transcriptional regulator of competence genes
VAYDEDLAHRVRELLAGTTGVREKSMFGGLAFLLGGHMAVCVSGQGGLMVRVPAEETDALLEREHVEPMVMAGRETRGWIRVGTAGLAGKRDLRGWVERGVRYAEGLPAK